MLRRILFTIAAIALGSAFQTVRAQSDEQKFEVSAHFTMLSVPTRTSNGTVLAEDRANVPGFGGRFGYNFSKYFGLEAEVNFFPRDREVEGGRKIQGLFGMKAGKRSERFGLFGKARMGFIRYEKGDYFQFGGCPTVFPPPLGCFTPVATTNLAFDLGGVIEVYPSKRTLFRFDAGDTIVHFSQRNVAVFQSNPSFFPMGLVVYPVPAETKHNLQASAGFGFRF
jgi:hypothetical protein